MSKYVDGMLKQGKTLLDLVPLNWKKYSELLNEIRNLPKTIPVPSPFPTLNTMTGGFEDGLLYILGAPPKQGKTNLAISMMYQQAKQGSRSLIFSYEVGWQKIVEKFSDMEKQDGVVPGSVDLPMYIPTELHRGGSSLQLQWLLEAILKAKTEGIQFVVIDYLHFLIPYTMTENFSIVVGNVVREIKNIAMQCKMPILLIVAMKNLQTKREPTYWDIRDSSMIMHEADDVMVMYRLYKSQVEKMSDLEQERRATDQRDDYYSPVSVLSLELNREHGESGNIYLWHNGAYFEEINKKDIMLRFALWDTERQKKYAQAL